MSEFIAHAMMHGGMQVLGGVGVAVEQVGNTAAPVKIPDVGALLDMVHRGYLSPTQLPSVAALQGVQVNPGVVGTKYEDIPFANKFEDIWNRYFYATAEIPTVAEYFEISNRRLTEDPAVEDGLRQWGFYDGRLRKQLANLRLDIPGPSDLVRFSVRHCWEPDLLSELGYNAEFPGKIIDYWHACKGLDYPLFTGPFGQWIAAAIGEAGANFAIANNYFEAGLPEPTWAQFYWYSHWILPSPGQGYEALFRLRPDRNRKYDPPQARGIDFTQKELDLLLRANDYPPKYRPILSAIAHRLPGVRFIRDFRKQGVYDFEAVLEWALRWGYSEQDALDIAADIERNVLASEDKKTTCRGCATCDQAFEVGILSKADLAACYTGYGLAEADAAKMAELADLKLRVRRLRELVASVRKRFLKGSITDLDAQRLLQGAGVVQDRINDYLADWRQELETARKELSAGQAVRYACRGIISMEEFTFRLTNLGYPAADQVALIGEVMYCQGQLTDQAAAKLARGERQKKADAYTQARRARQSLVEAQRYLASHGTPKNLHDWFCSGNIGESEVYTRLNALGWPDLDITRFLSDCKSGKKPTGAGLGKAPVVPDLVPPSVEGQAIEGLP
jgi:hypothetical protein